VFAAFDDLESALEPLRDDTRRELRCSTVEPSTLGAV
jgi:hypothetical protein